MARTAGLHHKLGIADIIRVSPTGAFEVNFAMAVSRIIAVGKQAEHHFGVKLVNFRPHPEPVAAVTKAARGINFRTLPLIGPVRDAQVKPAQLGSRWILPTSRVRRI